MGKKNYIQNDFYCIKSGNKSLPLLRKYSLQKEKFHRKKLYCYHCQEVCNHVECRSLEDVEEFLQAFENGEYLEEAEESTEHVRNSANGQIDIFKNYEFGE